MRTTITIDDGLLATVKRCAAAKGLTVGEYLEEGARQLIARDDIRPARSADIELPTFSTGGFLPGIDPSSNRSLSALLDEEDYEHYVVKFEKPSS